MTLSPIVAVSDVPAHVQAGAITYWSLRGDVERAALEDAWNGACLDPDMLMPTPSAEASLRSAMQRAASTSTEKVLLRPMTRGAWALVAESVAGTSAQDARLRHHTKLKAWLDPRTGDVTVDRPPEHQLSLGSEPDARWFDTIADTIYDGYAHHQDYLTSGEVGAWLIKLATGYASAVSLRKMGGIYFVPPATMGLWDEVVDIVRSCGSAHTVHLIPALRTADVVAAVTEAVMDEAQSTIESLRADAAEATLGSRGMRNRRQQAEALRDKLAAYRGLLGTALKGIGEQLDMASAEISVAIIQAELAEKAVKS